MHSRIPSTARAGALLLTTLAATSLTPAVAHAAKDDLLLISTPTLLGDPPSTGFSDDAAISSDGSVVAFESDGDTLSQADDDSVGNIFVRETRTGVTTLVSRQTGTGGASAGANAGSLDPAISGDGRFVVFQSGADNLSTEDDNTVTNIFVRDLQTNTTIFVSRASGAAGAPSTGTSTDPGISRDGRFVVFESLATNLSDADVDAARDIFIRDLVLQTTTFVSRAAGVAGAGADDSSDDPVVSADGQRVAFESIADNLSTEDSDAVTNIFVRDLTAGTTTLINRADGAAGPAGTGSSGNLSISDSGQRIAFDSVADNLSAEDTDGSADVFLRDVAAGTTTLVSRAAGAAGAAGSDASTDPSLSADGRYVTFESAADNLSTEDTDSVTNVFSRDVVAGSTTLVSRQAGASGAATSASSLDPAISGDGRFVAFESGDAALSTVDNDPATDVFRRDVVGDPPAPVTPPATPTAPPTSSTGASTATGSTTAARPRLSSLLSAPSTTRCRSTRRLTLRLRNAGQITKLTIRISGRAKAVTVRGSNLRAAINLTGLPRGRYTVTVTATLADGSTQKVTKRYRTCTPKKRQ